MDRARQNPCPSTIARRILGLKMAGSETNHVGFRRKPNGQFEVELRERLFASSEGSRQVVIPRENLSGFRLSEIPDEFGIRTFVEAQNGQSQPCCYTVFAFADGVAWAQVEAVSAIDAHAARERLRALKQAVHERQVAIGDVEEDHFSESEQKVPFGYVVTIPEDMWIEQAIAEVERTIAALEKRRGEILGLRTRTAVSSE